MSQAREAQRRVEYRQANTFFTFQRDGSVFIPPLTNHKIPGVIFAALIGKTTLQHQRHLATTVGMLGNTTPLGDALQRKLMQGVTGFQIADAEGLGYALPDQVGIVAVDQAVQ